MQNVDEYYTIYENDRRKAGKEHICGACGDTIRKGDFYHNVSILFDGSWSQVKRCLRCEQIHAHLRDLRACNHEWPDERLSCGESYEDVFNREPPEQIAAMAFISGSELQPK